MWHREAVRVSNVKSGSEIKVCGVFSEGEADEGGRKEGRKKGEISHGHASEVGSQPTASHC